MTDARAELKRLAEKGKLPISASVVDGMTDAQCLKLFQSLKRKRRQTLRPKNALVDHLYERGMVTCRVRGAALIAQGRVTVNGSVVRNRDHVVKPGDTVAVNTP